MKTPTHPILAATFQNRFVLLLVMLMLLVCLFNKAMILIPFFHGATFATL